jgi:molybdate/tungstate transport system substrate-binding protein
MIILADAALDLVVSGPMPGPSASSIHRRVRRSRVRLAGAALVAISGAASVLAVGAPASAGAAKLHSGPVIVLTAGSLETIMKTAVEPAFHKATGYTVTDISHGSTALAQDIKTGVYKADVFWSAAPTADKVLMGAANHNWVSWYATFATSTLVLGYNPKSKFAEALRTEPWWKVITRPGFLLGRTNPVTDPKGRLAVAALREAAKQHGDPQVGAIATKKTTVFTETSLVGRLQSGQLDAGFFYAVEASAAHFPTVPLTGVTEHAGYTLTVVAKAPHPAAADALVAWLLSSTAEKLLAAHGLHELSKPVLTGNPAAVPESLRKVIT